MHSRRTNLWHFPFFSPRFPALASPSRPFEGSKHPPTVQRGTRRIKRPLRSSYLLQVFTCSPLHLFFPEFKVLFSLALTFFLSVDWRSGRAVNFNPDAQVILDTENEKKHWRRNYLTPAIQVSTAMHCIDRHRLINNNSKLFAWQALLNKFNSIGIENITIGPACHPDALC